MYGRENAKQTPDYTLIHKYSGRQPRFCFPADARIFINRLEPIEPSFFKINKRKKNDEIQFIQH
jgi:hypothetical protein